jgi:circadian clock protein KaiC
MADGVVRLSLESLGGRTVRALKVQKMRGRTPLLGRHSLAIGDDGAVVFARVESLTEPTDAGLSERRKPLGLDVLDELMGGGPPERSLTLVAGAPATGKTLVGLGFIAAGVEQGDQGVILTFRETPRQLEDKAAAFGLDLRGAVGAGRGRAGGWSRCGSFNRGGVLGPFL